MPGEGVVVSGRTAVLVDIGGGVAIGACINSKRIILPAVMAESMPWLVAWRILTMAVAVMVGGNAGLVR